jgi:hypothetical protein
LRAKSKLIAAWVLHDEEQRRLLLGGEDIRPVVGRIFLKFSFKDT